MTEHRPFATLQADIFPEDSFLLDADEKLEMGVEEGDEQFEDTYTPEQVAREAWSNIIDWVNNGYRPVLTVTMPDGSTHDIDLERT